jgi:hypothetical protein
MTDQIRIAAVLLAVLAVAALAGCGDDDDEGDGNGDEPAPLAGTFVGKVSQTDAFVSVVAEPAGDSEEVGAVTVYINDGKGLSEEFAGDASGEEFEATAESEDATASGTLTEEAATGTVELPDGEARYTARAASATAGLYDLEVTGDGSLRGASAAGVALKGETPLPETGAGSLELADGTKLEFELSANTGDPVELRPGQVQMIVLPGGQLRGAGLANDAGGEDPGFFVSSTSE